MRTLNDEISELFRRLQQLEIRATRTSIASGDALDDSSLVWNTSLWEAWPSGTPSYSPGSVVKVGSTVVLHGMTRRTSSTSMTANTRNNSLMATLPEYWVPNGTVVLICPMGTSAPDAQTAVHHARVEVRPDRGVYYTGGSLTMTQGGWVAWQGAFLTASG
jgi:hypothetical protein